MTKKKFKSANAKVTAYMDAPDWEGAPSAALGEFSCKSPEDGIAIITEAISHIKAQGIRQIIGPMNGDTWHSYRFVTQTDDSTPFLLEPTNKPYDVEVFEHLGFQKISSYFSAKVPLENAAKNKPKSTEEFTIQAWDGSDPKGLFEQVYELSTKAFAKNAFYKPISKDDFLDMYMPIVPMLKKELIFFARSKDDSLAGFLFGIPDYAKGPATSSVILKTYASLSKGAGQHMAYAFHQTALKEGYETAIHALIHDDNLSAVRSAAEGAEIFRRYSLFGLRLDA